MSAVELWRLAKPAFEGEGGPRGAHDRFAKGWRATSARNAKSANSVNPKNNVGAIDCFDVL